MRDRVARLRIWLLGSAVFLMLVIAGFVGTARYVRHRLKNALMTKLGVTVTAGASGYTLSRSDGSRTIFTLHAAKWEPVPNSNGVIALHGVSIVLYGKKGDRSDRIYGDDFEYDKNANMVRAKGLVHIDLEAQGGKTARPEDAGADGKVLHVTTSGLVYMEKLGVAATGEYIEFQMAGMKGHATGADYSSDSGLLMLHSAVSMEGVTAGRAVKLTAVTAEFDDQDRVTSLTQAKYESQGQTMEAAQATLHSRPDGTLARVEAQGNVTGTSKGTTVVSQRADVALNAAGEPQSALLTGGVRYAQDGPLRQVAGQAEQATIAFVGEKQPQPQHAVFTGAVHITERTRTTAAAKEPWSTRDLTAARVDAVLAPTGPGQSQLEDAEATGNPHLTFLNSGAASNGIAASGGRGTTELSADDLKAHMILASDAKQPPQLDTIAGRGHTMLHQVSADGSEQTSAGDSLDAKFRANAEGGAARERLAVAAASTVGSVKVNRVGSGMGRQAADLLVSAVQQGHITMMRRVTAKIGNKPGTKEDVQHAVAERAVYDGDLDRMTLTGAVQVLDAGSELWANQVTLDHRTGNSQAVGAVKVDYVQNSARNSTHDGETVMNGAPGGTTESTHILADRAEMDHATDVATFHGQPARLWQGASQVQAPVIELARAQKRLVARGEALAGGSSVQQAAQVHTVLVSAGSGEVVPGAKAAGSTAAGCANTTAKSGAGGSGAAAQTANVVRIASGGLVYSGISNEADFTGGFRADSAEGTIRANAGTAYLQQSGAPAPATTVPSLTGHLQRVVAAGHVDIEQPGFRATGERLVYTADDRVFLLTGDDRTPPEATDAKGTTSAAALRFHSTCDDSGGVSVEALSAVPGEPAQRVRTETRVGNDEKKEKGRR